MRTETMTGDHDTWYGLTTSGDQTKVGHDELMAWAYRHDKQFDVGWSNAFKMPGGRRLVRGTQMIAEARDKGWDDLADGLEAAGFVDTEDINAD